MIPKIAHFYWGGITLPFMRFLSVWSFVRHNPGWEVRLYVPKEVTKTVSWDTHEQKYGVVGKDYMKDLERSDVRAIKFDFGELRSLSEVHKSDFLRWKLLYCEGGLWSDMDILYMKPVPELKGEFGFCLNKEYRNSVGFLYSEKGSAFYGFIQDCAKEEFDSQYYQSIGALLLNRYFPSEEVVAYQYKGTGFNIPMDWVYPYDAQHIGEIFEEGVPKRFTSSTVGIHWFAGHSKAGEFINGSNKRCLLGNLVRKETQGSDYELAFF